jgi:HPt (histidine-containing phosphotransfer) domain-containing protein
LILSAGGEKRFQDLVTLFLDSLNHDVKSMRAAMIDRNVSELKEVAHELKGTSGSMGASRLVALCVALEEACANEHLQGVEKVIGEIEAQADVVRQILAPSTYC